MASVVLPVCAVPDDQLALPAPDGRHGIDALQPRVQRAVDGLAVDDAGASDSTSRYAEVTRGRARQGLPSALTTRPAKRPRRAPAAPCTCAGRHRPA